MIWVWPWSLWHSGSADISYTSSFSRYCIISVPVFRPMDRASKRRQVKPLAASLLDVLDYDSSDDSDFEVGDADASGNQCLIRCTSFIVINEWIPVMTISYNVRSWTFQYVRFRVISSWSHPGVDYFQITVSSAIINNSTWPILNIQLSVSIYFYITCLGEFMYGVQKTARLC